MADQEDTGELMYIKCSHCGAWLDVKPGQMNQISHTICPDCFRAFTGNEPAQSAPPATGRKSSNGPSDDKPPQGA